MRRTTILSNAFRTLRVTLNLHSFRNYGSGKARLKRLRFIEEKISSQTPITNHLETPSSKSDHKPETQHDTKPVHTSNHTKKDKHSSIKDVKHFETSSELSKYLKQTLTNCENPNDAIECFKHNQHIADSQSYLSLLLGLLWCDSPILDIYKQMIKNKIKLHGKALTALLSCIAVSVKKSKRKEKLLKEAHYIFNSVRSQASIHHVNAMLKIYSECAEIGGWDLAWILFEQLGDSAERDNSSGSRLWSIHPDVISFTIMIKLCSKAGTESATECGFQLWNEVLKLNKSKESGYLRPKIDNPLLCAMLQLYIHAPILDESKNPLKFIEDYFRLPIKPNDNTLPIKRSFNVQTITLLLDFANKIKFPELGIFWFDKLQEYRRETSKDPSTPMADYGLYKALSTLLISAHQYERLWSILEGDPHSPPSIALHLCAQAICAKTELKGKWYERSHKIIKNQPKLGVLHFNDLLNYVECCVLSDHFHAGIHVCFVRKEYIQYWIRSRFEKGLEKIAQDSNLILKRSDFASEIKMLRYMILTCQKVKKSQSFVNDMKRQLSLELLETQANELFKIWDRIESIQKKRSEYEEASLLNLEKKGVDPKSITVNS